MLRKSLVVLGSIALLIFLATNSDADLITDVHRHIVRTIADPGALVLMGFGLLCLVILRRFEPLKGLRRVFQRGREQR